MHLPKILWENACVPRYPAMTRAAAALLAGVLALAPAAQAAGQKTTVLVLPYAVFPGAPEAAARIVGLVEQELRGREELKLVELKAQPAKADKQDALAQARSALARAADLAQRSHHAAAADYLQRAISFLTGKPSVLDEAAGQLLSDAALQLAVERLVAGDEDGGDAALAQLVRLAPEREVNARDYPPAFLVELQGVRRRLLAAPRGSLRVLAPPGAGEARVFVDGRAARSAPVLVKDLIPGEHFVRVERSGVAWGQKVVAIAGVETPVAPQPGADGPAAELTGALLQGELDRAAATAAGKLARSAGAQAAVFGAALKSGEGVAVRSFLCLAKGDRVFALAPLELDAELLGGMVQMVKVGDDVVAKLAAPPAEAALPVSLGAAKQTIPEVEAAPPPPAPEPEAVAVPLAPLVAPAAPAPVAPAAPAPPEPALRVAVPAAPEPPSRALVIPRRPDPEEEPPVTARAARPAQPAPQQRLQALEPEAVKTVREAPPRKNNTLLWVVAGVLVAGGLATGGYLLYQGNQTPTTATVNVRWPH